jgi:hypothetical protein
MLSCVLICNLEGLVLDFVGLLLKHTKRKGPTAQRLKAFIVGSLHHGEFPYDWGAGAYIYLIFLSAIFLGSIVMEVNAFVRSGMYLSVLNKQD